MNERDELMLDSMGTTPTGFEIKTHAGGPETAETLLFIADSMRSMLDEHEAPNYLEMELKGTDHKRYIMTLQRAGKVTPHQARVKAEEALEAGKPRIITTAEELDALPYGAVVLDRLDICYRLYRDPAYSEPVWCVIGETSPSRPHGWLPATVLHEGTQP